MKYKTSELFGAMLDAAVAKALGMSCRIQHYSKEQWDGIQQPFDGDVCIVSCILFQPSTSWAQGGPIIEHEQIILNPGSEKGWWEAGVIFDYGHEGPESNHWICGPTPLIAAMRAYVVSKLGDEVDI